MLQLLTYKPLTHINDVLQLGGFTSGLYRFTGSHWQYSIVTKTLWQSETADETLEICNVLSQT